MKQLLIVAFVAMSFVANAQNTAAHRLFDKYEDEKGFTSVLISEYAFELMADVAKGEEKEFEQAAQMITSLRILTADETPLASAFLDDLKKAFKLKQNSYKPLMTVKSDGEEVLFYLREQNKKITEFVLLVQDPENPVMILIEGEDIDLKKLKNVAGNTNIDVLDELNNIDN